MAKISARRKDPLKQDEVLTFAQRLVERLQAHRKPVLAAVVCLAVLLAGAGTFRYWQASRREAAAAALAAVRPKLEGEAPNQEALKDLDRIVSRYRGQPAAREAALYRANLLYRLGRYEDAVKAYRDLLADPTLRKEPGMEALVMESLSYCYEGMGNYGEAARVLQPLVEKTSGAFQSDLTRRLAWLWDRAGNPREARKYWEKLLERPPSPALVPYLQEKLAAAPPEN